MALPLFTDFGKAVKDILSKKYSDKSFDLTSKYSSDVTSETSLSLSNGNAVDSNLKVTYKNANFGELEGDFSVTGKLKSTLKLTKLVDNLTLKLGLNSKELDKAYFADEKEKGGFAPKPFVSIGADYAATVSDAQVNVSTSANVNEAGALVDVNAVVGQDGLATGGFVKLAVNKFGPGNQPRELLQDVGLGVQYSNSDYTVGMTSSNFWQNLAVSQYLNFSPDYQLGSQFDWNIENHTSTVSIGSNYQVDKSTLLKLKGVVGNDTKGQVFKLSSFVQYALSNQTKVGVTANIDATSPTPFVPTGFGVSVTLGDQ